MVENSDDVIKIRHLSFGPDWMNSLMPKVGD